jgi:hypothetical protein
LSASQKNRMASGHVRFSQGAQGAAERCAGVRTPIARFRHEEGLQVEGVTDSEREAAWRRIRAAARKYGVEVKARGWRSLMKGGGH